MSPEEQPVRSPLPTHGWKEEVVFNLFADPVRRRIFLSLARQDQQTPSQLLGTSQRNLDVTMKRLVTMRSDRFVVMKKDTVDKRRRLWSLAPGLPITTTETGKVIDFGFLTVPLAGSGDAERVGVRTDAGHWMPDAIYLLMGEPKRRKLLLTLARKPGQSGEQLKGKALFMHAMLKHLAALRSAGLVMMSGNAVDGRRHLYSIAPTAPMEINEQSVIFKFGFCTVRLS